jgi:hypothetical protein
MTESSQSQPQPQPQSQPQQADKAPVEQTSSAPSLASSLASVGSAALPNSGIAADQRAKAIAALERSAAKAGIELSPPEKQKAAAPQPLLKAVEELQVQIEGMWAELSLLSDKLDPVVALLGQDDRREIVRQLAESKEVSNVVASEDRSALRASLEHVVARATNMKAMLKSLNASVEL